MLAQAATIVTNPLFGASSAVAISLGLTALAMENRPRVPTGKVLLRALPSVVLLFIVWDVIALTVYVGLASKLSVLFRLASAWGTAFVVGLLIPQLQPRHVPSHPVWLSRVVGALSVFTTRLSETTQKQLDDSIAQEGRRQVDDIASGRAIENPHVVIDRLFEHHRIGITRRLLRNARLDLATVRGTIENASLELKCELLQEHLGWADFEMATRQVADDPMSILPTWPAVPDRRQRLDRRSPMVPHSPERRVEVSYRRKTDSPEILRYLQGSPESPQKPS
ncbi:MAG: hypothetical protein U0Q11_17030 [Vicinamibacterales bacterium]